MCLIVYNRYFLVLEYTVKRICIVNLHNRSKSPLLLCNMIIIYSNAVKQQSSDKSVLFNWFTVTVIRTVKPQHLVWRHVSSSIWFTIHWKTAALTLNKKAAANTIYRNTVQQLYSLKVSNRQLAVIVLLYVLYTKFNVCKILHLTCTSFRGK